MLTPQAPVTGAVTTRFSGAKKEWAWSYSKIKNSDICPKRHYEIDIAKAYKDTSENDPNSALGWGKRVHTSMAARLKSKTQLPIEMVDYEMFAKRIEDKVRQMEGELQVEQQYALTRAFAATGYFAPDTWYRGIADAIVLSGSKRSAIVVDWKTGKIQEDSVQLALMAQCIFSAFPTVQFVTSRFVWLKEHAETDEDFTRADMVRFWTTMLPRVTRLEKMAQTMDYPPTPNRLCRKYCPVVSCPFHGKEHR